MLETSAGTTDPTGPPAQPASSHDLAAFFAALGSFSPQAASLAAPAERPEPERPAELLDTGPAEVSADALGVAAFLDGIQSSVVVTWRAHRPVLLSYVAAGAVGPGGRPLAWRERLDLVASREDAEWAEEVRTTLPLTLLDAVEPPQVAAAAGTHLARTREHLERAVTDDVLAHVGDTHVLVDGTLVGRSHDTRLVGLSKTTATRYLHDESQLFSLPVGWRSARFVVPDHDPAPTRYSAYLRLHDASRRPWDFALVRLEAFDPDLLDAACALALDERQSPYSGDGRWDRHLASVRACEESLRTRTPAVFSLRR